MKCFEKKDRDKSYLRKFPKQRKNIFSEGEGLFGKKGKQGKFPKLFNVMCKNNLAAAFLWKGEK